MKKFDPQIYPRILFILDDIEELKFFESRNEGDEIVGCDIKNERKSAARLYNRLNPLLQMSFLEKSQENK